MAYSAPVFVVASDERTESGDSGPIQLAGMGRSVNLLVSATAADGTSPTLDLTVEWSHDGAVWAADADAFTQITEAGAAVKQFAALAPYYRLVWTIGGTDPSFTFSVSEYVT